jgi:nitroimidazol reductase NimA-like FMN-containing flavoprotein (pyridoxamine 5'-phosphate oxidase superfamily)
VPDDRAATAERAPIVALDEAECLDVLRRQRMCVVAMNDEGAPYAVPVYYGFDGAALYLGVAEGRKTRALDADSRVYIVVTEPGPGDSWRSVCVDGRATTLSDPGERAKGIEALIAHNRRAERGNTPPAAPRRSGGRILRIDDATITGRARR